MDSLTLTPPQWTRWNAPRTFNIDTKNGHIQKESPFPKHRRTNKGPIPTHPSPTALAGKGHHSANYFGYPAVSFQGCILINQKIPLHAPTILPPQLQSLHSVPHWPKGLEKATTFQTLFILKSYPAQEMLSQRQNSLYQKWKLHEYLWPYKQKWTYSHGEQHHKCTQMVMERYNLKRYRFFNSLSSYQTLQLRSLYASMSQTYRFPAHLQTTKNITHNFHSHKGSCLNLLVICSVCVHIMYIYIRTQTEYIV